MQPERCDLLNRAGVNGNVFQVLPQPIPGFPFRQVPYLRQAGFQWQGCTRNGCADLSCREVSLRQDPMTDRSRVWMVFEQVEDFGRASSRVERDEDRLPLARDHIGFLEAACHREAIVPG